MAINLKNIKWIFFDMGHTLVNETGVTHARYMRTVDDLCRQGTAVGIDAFEERVLEIGRTPGINMYKEAIREYGAPIRYTYLREMEAPYAASDGVLARLHQKYKLGIIASQPGGSLQRMRRYGLLEHLDLVYSSDEIGVDKPELAFFAGALRAAGCLPEEAIMVGDRIDNDIAPAKALGMHTVRLRQGLARYAEAEDNAHTADYDIPSIADLPGILDC